MLDPTPNQQIERESIAQLEGSGKQGKGEKKEKSVRNIYQIEGVVPSRHYSMN